MKKLKFFLRFLLQLIVATWLIPAHAGIYEDFFRAVAIDDERTLRAVLSRGFDPNTPDERGQTGLFLAMRESSLRAAELLLAHPDLKIDAVNAHDETALMMAALRGHPQWVRRFVARGAQVNRPGWTPLHYAASGPSVETVQALLDLGARTDPVSPRGSTPLMMAAQYGPEASVDLLVRRGADLRLRDSQGSTVLDYARRSGREPLVRLLEPLVPAAP